MAKAVFLNAAKLNYDQALDYRPFAKITEFQTFADSTEQEILERVQGYEIVITKELPIPGQLLSQFPASVKIICEAGTGYNNIDITVAKEKGILVTNVPSYSSEAVAQLAITFLLSLSCSLPQQIRKLQQGDFSQYTTYMKYPHFELSGRTLGLIGVGAIGMATAKIAKHLGMKVAANVRNPDKLKGTGIQALPLDTLLGVSDFVSIHVPLTEQTRHLINAERLSLMKPTAYLINTARGALVKEEDLVAALRNGNLAGAALDVQEVEPTPLNNPLFFMDNVILTPHIGWRRLESRQRLVDMTAANIGAFLAGTAQNVVN